MGIIDADTFRVEPFRTPLVLDDQPVVQNGQTVRAHGEFSGSLPQLSDSLEEEPIRKIIDNDVPSIDEIDSLLIRNDLAGMFEFRQGEDSLGRAGSRGSG